MRKSTLPGCGLLGYMVSLDRFERMFESPVPLGRFSSEAVHKDGGHTSEKKYWGWLSHFLAVRFQRGNTKSLSVLSIELISFHTRKCKTIDSNISPVGSHWQKHHFTVTVLLRLICRSTSTMHTTRSVDSTGKPDWYYPPSLSPWCIGWMTTWRLAILHPFQLYFWQMTVA